MSSWRPEPDGMWTSWRHWHARLWGVADTRPTPSHFWAIQEGAALSAESAMPWWTESLIAPCSALVFWGLLEPQGEEDSCVRCLVLLHHKSSQNSGVSNDTTKHQVFCPEILAGSEILEQRHGVTLIWDLSWRFSLLDTGIKAEDILKGQNPLWHLSNELAKKMRWPLIDGPKPTAVKAIGKEVLTKLCDYHTVMSFYADFTNSSDYGMPVLVILLHF